MRTCEKAAGGTHDGSHGIQHLTHVLLHRGQFQGLNGSRGLDAVKSSCEPGVKPQHPLLAQVAAAAEEHPELEAALRAKAWQYVADAAANSALTRLHSSTAGVLQQARSPS